MDHHTKLNLTNIGASARFSCGGGTCQQTYRPGGYPSGIIRKAVAAIPLLVVFVVIAANFGWFFGSPLHMVLFWVLAAAAW